MTLHVVQPQSEPARVLPFVVPPDGCERELLKVIELNRQGKIRNLFLAYDMAPADSHMASDMARYWFGQSCLTVLGLLEWAKGIVLAYMRGEVEE